RVSSLCIRQARPGISAGAASYLPDRAVGRSATDTNRKAQSFGDAAEADCASRDARDSPLGPSRHTLAHEWSEAWPARLPCQSGPRAVIAPKDAECCALAGPEHLEKRTGL